MAVHRKSGRARVAPQWINRLGQALGAFFEPSYRDVFDWEKDARPQEDPDGEHSEAGRPTGDHGGNHPSTRQPYSLEESTSRLQLEAERNTSSEDRDQDGVEAEGLSDEAADKLAAILAIEPPPPFNPIHVPARFRWQAIPVEASEYPLIWTLREQPWKAETGLAEPDLGRPEAGLEADGESWAAWFAARFGGPPEAGRPTWHVEDQGHHEPQPEPYEPPSDPVPAAERPSSDWNWTRTAEAHWPQADDADQDPAETGSPDPEASGPDTDLVDP